ncbi:mitochondrial enolase superfamily member 1-like isoform X2 [Rhopilema esculentum]
MVVITAVEVVDVRFPTSLELHGSDAMHKSPDYSAAYVTLHTNRGKKGHGIGFTLGKGTCLVVQAVELLKPLVVGVEFEEIKNNFRQFWKDMTNEDQLRWLGPEKGVIHIATAAIVNALWDLWAKIENKPLWKLVVDMEPEQLVSTIDFTYISDVITEQEAIEMLKTKQPGKTEREKYLRINGYPAYTTCVGWMGYSDEKIVELCRARLKEGWTSFKVKVGADIDDDVRRCKLVRQEIGWDNNLMMDANQRWDVDEAKQRMSVLRQFKPLWIEEPTSPDDILGHAAIATHLREAGVGVATGEHCQNRVIFKQLMQANAISFCQIDSCRVGGVNENLAIILMAAKFGVPVCPHAGGVGLCEMVQHLSIFDYICVSADLENRMIEYVSHLHEHFEDPVNVKNGTYHIPKLPGYGCQMKPKSIWDHTYPTGRVWTKLLNKDE